MLWKNAWIPGICIAFWRRRAITTGAGSRSFFGFRAMNSRPKLAVGFGPPAPAVLLIYSTAGSWLRRSASAFCRTAIASNDVSVAASVMPVRKPVSSCGKNPLGTMT